MNTSVNKDLTFSIPSAEMGKPALAVHRELRAGDVCPRCGEEKLDYDSTLNLACSRCGQALGGCFS